MLDFDAGKLIIVGIIALIFIPPKDLPRVLRQAGQLVGKMRRMASEFQGQFMDAMREADMADLRKEAQKLADGAKAQMGLGDIDAHNRSIMQAIERQDETKAAATSDTVPASPSEPQHKALEAKGETEHANPVVAQSN